MGLSTRSRHKKLTVEHTLANLASQRLAMAKTDDIEASKYSQNRDKMTKVINEQNIPAKQFPINKYFEIKANLNWASRTKLTKTSFRLTTFKKLSFVWGLK